MSANKPKDVNPVAEPEKKPFEHAIVYSEQAALEIMDPETFTRRKDVLESSGFELHSITVGANTLVVILAGKNKNVGHASEIKTPTQAQLDAKAKLAEAQAKQKAEADAKAKAKETAPAA